MPYAFVDLDLLRQNIAAMAARAGNKPIRVASKSVRCVRVLQEIFAGSPVYQGLMCFHAQEAQHLLDSGFDDLLFGYPIVHPDHLAIVARAVASGKRVMLMADLPEHLAAAQAVAAKHNVTLPVCMDLDCSSEFPGIYFGVRRSSIRTVLQAAAFGKLFDKHPNLRLQGVMGYEAQIAGLADATPGKAAFNAVVRYLKGRSIREVAARRAAVVDVLRKQGHDIILVNGGGTGSLESTRQEAVVTELTAGSGFYTSWLFDKYAAFRHRPAAAYAVEITRRPRPDLYTCAGGGYVASGATGPDKQPLPYLPVGGQLLDNEGAGEVQTPILYRGRERLAVGDPFFLRHAKAGELCERFNTLLLIEGGRVVDETPTYRGQGKCFI